MLVSVAFPAVYSVALLDPAEAQTGMSPGQGEAPALAWCWVLSGVVLIW